MSNSLLDEVSQVAPKSGKHEVTTEKGAKLFKGSKVMNAWSSISLGLRSIGREIHYYAAMNVCVLQGCFSATTVAATSQVSTRASWVWGLDLDKPGASSFDICFLFAKDLANQVRFSVEYTDLLKSSGRSPGRYLTPEAGEWFSGPSV